MPATAGSKARKGEVQFAKKTIGAALIKTLVATPQTIIAAPGKDVYIEFLSATLELKAGTEVLAETADNLAFAYTNGSGAQVSADVECTSFIDQAADNVTFVGPNTTEPIVTRANACNAPLVLFNTSGEFTGNASNDAELSVEVAYRLHYFG